MTTATPTETTTNTVDKDQQAKIERIVALDISKRQRFALLDDIGVSKADIAKLMDVSYAQVYVGLRTRSLPPTDGTLPQAAPKVSKAKAAKAAKAEAQPKTKRTRAPKASKPVATTAAGHNVEPAETDIPDDYDEAADEQAAEQAAVAATERDDRELVGAGARS